MYTNESSRDRRYLLGVVGLIIVAFLLNVGYGLLVSVLKDGTPGWITMVGTLGETIVLYGLGVRVFELILVPVTAFWLGTQYTE